MLKTDFQPNSFDQFEVDLAMLTQFLEQSSASRQSLAWAAWNAISRVRHMRDRKCDRDRVISLARRDHMLTLAEGMRDNLLAHFGDRIPIDIIRWGHSGLQFEIDALVRPVGHVGIETEDMVLDLRAHLRVLELLLRAVDLLDEIDERAQPDPRILAMIREVIERRAAGGVEK